MMKQINFEELQEITREVVGKLYMYKNVSIYYDEKENENYVILKVKLNDK